MFFLVLFGIWMLYGGQAALYAFLPLLGVQLIALGSQAIGRR